MPSKSLIIKYSLLQKRLKVVKSLIYEIIIHSKKTRNNNIIHYMNLSADYF